MKKWIAIFITALMTVSLDACGSNEQAPSQRVIERPQQTEAPSESQQEETEGGTGQEETEGGTGSEAEQTGTESAGNTQTDSGSNILIAYFTVPETDGVDTVANASRVATEDGVLGNTEFIATEIQKNLGGDLFAIETVQEYPGSHDPLLEFAYNEKSDDVRPELSTHIEDLSSYNYIFIGFPNWWGTMPMAMFTFLESYDFAGKTVIPFCTHEGSALGRSESDIAALIPEAELQKGLAVRGSNVDIAEDDVVSWLEELGFESLADGD